MHPEMARRIFAWLEAQGGNIGIGGGWRSTYTQMKNWLLHPTVFARPGNSFHESVTWASGWVGYAALDLVETTPGGGRHNVLEWADTANAPKYGLHTFVNNEPWHIQCIETRSVSAWKSAGSPDPSKIILPSHTHPTPPPAPAPVPPASNFTEAIVNALPALKFGSSGKHAGIAQSLMNYHGAALTVDGQFGQKSVDVVKYIQGREGLTQDGVVGPKTWAVLLAV